MVPPGSLLSLALGIVGLYACTAGPRPAQEAPEAGDDGARVVLGPGAARTQETAEAWIVYGVSRLAAVRARPASAHNQSRSDFAIELQARRDMLAYWRKLQSERDARDPYLDTLLAIEDAGLLEEYVLIGFGRPGWTLPPDALPALDLDAFLAYARENLVDHVTQTSCRVEDATRPEVPSIPGAALPHLEGGPDPIRCDRLDELRGAWERWGAEERTLDGVALAADQPQELLAALQRVRSAPAIQERGVTWVSPKAADLSFVVGFCEIDRGNPAAALAPLREAVALSPLAPMWQLELATALMNTGRLDPAEREIAQVIASTEDPCILGMAWRRRGYLLIERGQLREAYEAYSTSLAYNPGNAIALHEIDLIEHELERMGGAVPRRYMSPPRGAVSVTRCQGG